jgi:hypothetical protein
MNELPAIVETSAGRFTPGKLVAIGAIAQIVVAGALWQLSLLTLMLIAITSRRQPVIGIATALIIAGYLLLGYAAARRRSWRLATIFCATSVLALPWPLLSAVMAPHPG